MFERILVATDGSPSAARALDLARAQFPGARRCLLHVLDPRRERAGRPLDVPASRPPASGGPVGDDPLQGLEAGEEARVERGAVAETVIAAAQDWGADLIVLGTHGRRGLAHLVLGSVAEAVVRGATVPVLTVRAVQATAREDDVAERITGSLLLPSGG